MSIRGGESGKISIPCIANQQKECDAWSVCSDNHYHSDKFQSGDDNVSCIPSTYLDGKKEEDDASSVSSLSDYYSDEDYGDDDEDLGKQNVGEGERHVWNFCDPYEDDFGEISGKLRELMIGCVPTPYNEGGGRHNIHIYGYYRKRRGYGGYGIILRHVKSKKYISACYFASKGGSYLYYLLEGMKRCLEMVDEWGLHRFRWSINSRRAVHYYNNTFKDPIMLAGCFHYVHDVADMKFCRRCLTNQMLLTAANFELLEPVIRAILKLQYDLKFKYRGPCTEENIVAAHYIAKLGAEALEREMERGLSPDQVQEVKETMEKEELQALEEKTGLGVKSRIGERS
ncbi:hypothetical protein MKX03_006165 [Papaver bracteatum]|nr:hypothetical protein MKX03_006165 [Papaver bracteatum]